MMIEAALAGILIMASTPDRVVEGTLTDEGVVCQAVRGDDGELYTLKNLPEVLKAGDRVTIDTGGGPRPLMSTCDQGQYLEWVSVTLVTPAGETVQTWKRDV